MKKVKLKTKLNPMYWMRRIAKWFRIKYLYYKLTYSVKFLKEEAIRQSAKYKDIKWHHVKARYKAKKELIKINLAIVTFEIALKKGTYKNL